MTQKIAFSYTRFSSAEQAKGHSLDRQTERAEKWAAENGYVLDDSMRLSDEGISAFKGKNAEEGALSLFLEAIEQRKIPKGSVLIVESLDRLSRNEVYEARTLLDKIINAGIEVVSLVDGQHYKKGMDLAQMIFSLVSFARSNEESKLKSDRVGKAWRRKREDAISTKKAMTARLPKWLELDTDRKIIVIPERVEIVKRIFQMTIDGTGADLIAATFTREGIEPWGKSKKKNKVRDEAVWHKSYIRKILTNEAVKGLFTPTHIIEVKLSDDDDETKKMRVDAETIEGYFPTVIADSDFREAQLAMTSRKLGGGRVGRISNLFSHLVRCGDCGSSVVHVNKGPNANEHIVCSSARFGKCKYVSARYRPFEDAILQYCTEINLQDILCPDNRSELADATKRLSQAKTEMEKTEQARQKIVEAIEKLDVLSSVDFLAKRMDTLSLKYGELKTEVEVYSQMVVSIGSVGQKLQEHLNNIAELKAHMEGQSEEGRLEIRKKLKHIISRSVKEIRLFPNGLQDKIPSFDGKALTVQLFSPPIDDTHLIMERIRHMEENTGRDKCCFLVTFTNKHTRLFRWDHENSKFNVDSEVTSDKWMFGGENWDDHISKMNIGLPKINLLPSSTSKKPFGSQ